MLEKPAIEALTILTRLRDHYGLTIAQLEFLPIGADRNTAVYRAISDDNTPYFVKLRSGVFDEMTILVPQFLHDQGVRQVIAPVPTLSQQLWADLNDFRLMVFPFIEGHNGYEIQMLDSHWMDYGRALKALHSAELPPSFVNRIQRETYSAQWREIVRRFQVMVENTVFADPVSAELAAFLRLKQDVVNELVRRAEHFAAILKGASLPFVLCHADIHAANILIDARDHLYLVDWDTLILAPKERDLMFTGGGQFGDQRSPQEEEAGFYQGYGATTIDERALAYYRYERIVEDIAAYCEQILLTNAGGKDRENGLRQLTGQFLPGHVIDLTFRADKNRR